MNTIFKNYKLHICISETNNIRLDAKAVQCYMTTINPRDGKEYTKYAGWIGRSMALHGGSKTPGYIYEAACGAIAINEQEIKKALIEAGKTMDEECRAGIGVTFSISHPRTDAERKLVRRKMQLNAPLGTFH